MRTQKIIYHTILFVFTLATLGACRSGQNTNKGITVTIEPLKYFTDKLTSGKIDVNVMVPMGSSPASYAPTTSQLMAMSSSVLYVQVGHLGFEDAWMTRLKELNPEMDILNLSSSVKLISGEDHVHGDHVHKGGIDPHIWMSPKVVMDFLPSLKKALTQNFPEEKKLIEDNYLLLLTEVEGIHNLFSNLPQGSKPPKFMIFHPALTYLARDYGMEQISIEYEGKEPSPQKLKALIDQAREEKIDLIFIQEEFDQRNAEMVRQATNAQLIRINPLAYDWPQVMKNIYNLLSKHLQ